jgi:hypothetical protein
MDKGLEVVQILVNVIDLSNDCELVEGESVEDD